METPKLVRERDPNERRETGAEGRSDAAGRPPAAPDGDDPAINRGTTQASVPTR
jgi:hypothetical protein